MRSRKLTTFATVALTLGLGFSVANAQKKLYWVWGLPGAVMRANLDGSGIEVLVDAGLAAPSGIALDAVAGMMYWTDRGAEKIQRANLQIPPGETADSRTDIEDLVTGLSAPWGIALDVEGGKMYWTHVPPSDTRKIQRANLDGSGVEDLVTGLSAPWGIALDAAGGKMYWADIFRIQRANLDGSNVEDLVVSTADSSPYALALDLDAGKMYWTSAGIDFGLDPKIQRANLNGSDVEDLVELEMGWQFGIALDPRAGKMYWTSMQGKIERANLDGSGVETVLENLSGQPMGIALGLGPPPIPTLSEWGVLTVIALLLGVGTMIIRRRGAHQSHRPHWRRLGGERL